MRRISGLARASPHNREARAERTELHTESGDMYAREIESFSNSILTGSPLEVPASDAVQVQRVIELAYRSNDEKKLFDL